MLCGNKTFSKVYIAAAVTETFYLNKIALLLWVHTVLWVLSSEQELNWNLFFLKDERCQILCWWLQGAGYWRVTSVTGCGCRGVVLQLHYVQCGFIVILLCREAQQNFILWINCVYMAALKDIIKTSPSLLPSRQGLGASQGGLEFSQWGSLCCISFQCPTGLVKSVCELFCSSFLYSK